MRKDLDGTEKRIIWLDVARTLAILSVTFNHALSRSFDTHIGTLAEYQSVPHLVSAIKALLYVFSRGGVPWFLMITAVLLLSRDYTGEEKTKLFMKRNWLPLFITSEIWLAIIFFYLVIFGTKTGLSGIGQILFAFIQNQLFINQTTFASMWYLSMILILYLMIPVFAVALQRIDGRYIKLLLGVGIMIGMIIPNINAILSGFGIGYQLEPSVSITDLFSLYCIYLFAGYFIGKGELSRLNELTVAAIALISYLLTSIFQYWIYSTSSDYYVRYSDFGVLLFSVFTFEIIRRKGDGIKVGKNWFTRISKISFAIYFVHVSIMYALNTGMRYLPIAINHLTKFLILECVAVPLSIVIISVLSHVRVFKKYLFMIKD